VYRKRGIIYSGFMVSMLLDGLLKVVACDEEVFFFGGEVKLFILEVYSRGSGVY